MMIVNYNRNLIPTKMPTKSDKKLVKSESSNAETNDHGISRQADDIEKYFSTINSKNDGKDNLYKHIEDYNKIAEEAANDDDAEFERKYLLNILI